MQDILDKYPANDTDYLLPIIRIPGMERTQYRRTVPRTAQTAQGTGATDEKDRNSGSEKANIRHGTFKYKTLPFLI